MHLSRSALPTFRNFHACLSEDILVSGSLKSWILAARPKTLPAALVPVWVGTVLAGRLGTTDATLGWCTLLSAIAIQVATNFFNDALDSEKGADTEKRLGPVRASATGLIAGKTMMTAAWITLGVAVAFSVPLVLAHGWPIIAIGVVSMLCAYAYTGGPFPLAYRGMGEVFVVAFFGVVAVMGTVFVHTGEWHDEGWLMGAQVGLLCAVLIAINNSRDRAEDERSRKYTLAVLFGQSFAEVEIMVLCLLPLAVGAIWHFVFGWWEAMIYPLALLPLGLVIVVKVLGTDPGRIYNRFLAMSAAQLVGYAILITLAAQ
ncbi:MAG: 1,4-dihydroxy-2-naphthoate octaprenyltransferase [Verrucomicrobiales bacterium]|jgi:1,4-dihydroxy-2-naphthoate octaprenyltransferase